MALITEAQRLPERDMPAYLAIKGTEATYARVLTFGEVPYPVKTEPSLSRRILFGLIRRFSAGYKRGGPATGSPFRWSSPCCTT